MAAAYLTSAEPSNFGGAAAASATPPSVAAAATRAGPANQAAALIEV